MNVAGLRRWLAASAAAGPPANTNQPPPALAAEDSSHSARQNARRLYIQRFQDRGALSGSPVRVYLEAMERPARFEHNQWVGDKRDQVVHDLDACTAPDVIGELMEAETYLAFGPDTLAEARNRNYRRCNQCEGIRSSDSNGE